MTAGRILVVDDDRGITDVVSYALRSEGFEVVEAATGAQAIELAGGADGEFDVVILDLMLPDVAGTAVCRRLRAESTVPIIMLTAKDAEADRVLGLELGADDYVTKPFSVAELASRVRAILRRRDFERGRLNAPVRQIGPLRLDFVRHDVDLAGRQIELTPSEFKILALLAEEPGRVFSRREIVEHLWDSSHVGDQHVCDVHISNLRRKLEDDPARPQRIVNVRGAGYKLVAPGEGSRT